MYFFSNSWNPRFLDFAPVAAAAAVATAAAAVTAAAPEMIDREMRFFVQFREDAPLEAVAAAAVVVAVAAVVVAAASAAAAA